MSRSLQMASSRSVQRTRSGFSDTTMGSDAASYGVNDQSELIFMRGGSTCSMMNGSMNRSTCGLTDLSDLVVSTSAVPRMWAIAGRRRRSLRGSWERWRPLSRLV